MSKVIFHFKESKTDIFCKENEKMREICSRYASKIGEDLDSLLFIYSGKSINLNLTFSEVINSSDSKNKCFILLVYSIEDKFKINNLIKSKQTICPKCSENATFEIQNYKIKLTCKNGDINYLLISQYENSQKIDQSKVICDICKTNYKAEAYQNILFKCNNCKKNLCNLCKCKHDTLHNIINYDDKDFICEEHSEYYNLYCKSCKKNLCSECEKFHKDHEILTYGKIVPDKNELIKCLEEFKKTKDNFIGEIKKVINKIKKVMKNLEILYKIIEEKINNYIKLKSNKNYEIIMNMNKFNTDVNKIIKEMKQIIDNQNNIYKFMNILNIYGRMESDININNDFQNYEELNKKYNDLKKQNEQLNKELSLKIKMKNEKNKQIQALKNEEDLLQKSKPLFTIRSFLNEKKCIDSKSLNYNETTHIWDYSDNNKNQIFELENGSKNGFYYIKNHFSGYYLGMENGIINLKRKSETLQNFKFIDCKNGFYIIENESGYVVDLNYLVTDNGNSVGFCEKNGSGAQQWKLVLL